MKQLRLCIYIAHSGNDQKSVSFPSTSLAFTRFSVLFWLQVSPNHVRHQPGPSRPPLLLCFLIRDTRSPFLIGEDTHLQEWEGRKPDTPIRSLLTSWGRRGWPGSRSSCSPGAVISSNCPVAEGARASNPRAVLPGGMPGPASAPASRSVLPWRGMAREWAQQVGGDEGAACLGSSEFRGQVCLFFPFFFFF